jgi:hypothetical protein
MRVLTGRMHLKRLAANHVGRYFKFSESLYFCARQHPFVGERSRMQLRLLKAGCDFTARVDPRRRTRIGLSCFRILRRRWQQTSRHLHVTCLAKRCLATYRGAWHIRWNGCGRKGCRPGQNTTEEALKLNRQECRSGLLAVRPRRLSSISCV